MRRLLHPCRATALPRICLPSPSAQLQPQHRHTTAHGRSTQSSSGPPRCRCGRASAGTTSATPPPTARPSLSAPRRWPPTSRWRAPCPAGETCTTHMHQILPLQIFQYTLARLHDTNQRRFEHFGHMLYSSNLKKLCPRDPCSLNTVQAEPKVTPSLF